jgi:hypothetical protein
MEEEQKPKRGRPATGQTTKRNVRIGAPWDRGEELAEQLGIKMTAYVERAIRELNARVERQQRRDQ